MNRIGHIWTGYLKGQFLLTLFVSGLTFVAALFLGLPFPIINTLIVGVCENIPTFGPIAATVIGGLFALIMGSNRLDVPNWVFMLIIVALYVLIQQLESWLIKPKIMGKAVDMHPLLIFIGMAVFSSFFGIPGMLLAVPVMGTVRELFRYLFYRDDFYALPEDAAPQISKSAAPATKLDHTIQNEKTD